jgi:hypothetical protein
MAAYADQMANVEFAQRLNDEFEYEQEEAINKAEFQTSPRFLGYWSGVAEGFRIARVILAEQLNK